MMNRRSFLTTAACAGATVAVGAELQTDQTLWDARKNPIPNQGVMAVSKRKKRIKVGLATYSYWHFHDPKVSIETVIDKAGEMGVAGLDILHQQMDIPEKAPLTAEHRAYLQKLKRQAFRNGIDLVCLSTHQTFLSPDAAKVSDNVEHTKKCIEICYELGVPSMRINTGRWGTIPDFDELMRKRGIEPILPGCTEDEGFKWVGDAIQRCLGKAEECGVILALENHWGLARTPEGQLRILNSIQSPWLGALMDTGNFLEDPYDKLKMIAPKTLYAQAKTYYGGGEWYTLDLDYHRIAKILYGAGYTGYICLEFEGKENPDVAVPKSIAVLREAFGS
ncbi:MAG TPA: TIM barrel protein [Candidatus Binatia bacterium]|jgi:L-ribulose-5-phosphate 3-epimerase|nr:TIM barrel protein [Candidatus Binatia bacterium]